MGKIVKKSVEKIVLNKKKFSLGMKGEFKIEFANDNFGPYNFKFQREDCYFNDGLEDRGTSIFPLKNKMYENTEIFLENDDIVVAIGERGSLAGDEKEFLDVINIKTEKKYRLFTEEVNLIYNTDDKIVINAKDEGVFKSIVLNIETMEKVEEIEEELNAFFKIVYNSKTRDWMLLDFHVADKNETDEEKKYQKGYFGLKKLNLKGKPEKFIRKEFRVLTDIGEVDVWEESIN